MTLKSSLLSPLNESVPFSHLNNEHALEFGTRSVLPRRERRR